MLNHELFCLYLFCLIITGKRQQFTEIHSQILGLSIKKEKKSNRSTAYIKEFQMRNADYTYQK